MKNYLKKPFYLKEIEIKKRMGYTYTSIANKVTEELMKAGVNDAKKLINPQKVSRWVGRGMKPPAEVISILEIMFVGRLLLEKDKIDKEIKKEMLENLENLN